MYFLIILVNKYRSVEHQIPLIAVGLRETKELAFKPQFKVCVNSHATHMIIPLKIHVSLLRGW